MNWFLHFMRVLSHPTSLMKQKKRKIATDKLGMRQIGDQEGED